MSTKRFIQLFICYALSMVIAIALTNCFHFTSQIGYMIVASIIGYIVITIPLTVMTVMKNKK
ncbi:hypothetical protein ACSFB8_06025 [Enterococcus faecalis]